MNAEQSVLVLASGNAGKLRELEALLGPSGFDLRPQSDWNTPKAVEDGATFVENALIKARNAAQHSGHAAIADDSGLVVPALGGAPGIYSARYSAEPGGDAANNQLLLRNMKNLHGEQRRAHFHCTVVLLSRADDPAPLIASANWWGQIRQKAAGSGGFGYDPLFQVEEFDCSSAELESATKNRISHRGQALAGLGELLSAARHG